MINLLPSDSRVRVAEDYRFRLVAVAALLLAALVSLAAAFLLPAYFFAWVARNDAQTQSALADQSLAQQNLTTSGQDERNATALMKAVRGQLAVPRPSAVIASLMTLRSVGISVRQIQYGATGGVPTVQLAGIADTRAHLLAFKQALEQGKGVTAVDLPVESLIASTSAPFSITVGYSPQPASATP